MLHRRSATHADSDTTAACVANGISKVYGGRDTAVRALRDVTLRIPSGEFTAIMGPSGSGKSTLLHCLAALDTPTSGKVFLGRTELTALSRRQQAQVRRDRIGFVFQAFNLVPTLDAIENITLPQLLAGRRPDQQWLDHVVEQIGLSDRLHHRPSELSGGQQQRVALARALAGRPEVIFADEPTGNLDTTASAEILVLLRDAVDQFKQTVVTVTHDPTIAVHADRILFFTDGRVVGETDRPDVDDVLARLRHLNDSGGASGGGHEPERADGQDSMRSRRRQQPGEQTPGRPMVGSDDEMEVARQERWLERIRQQFEAEQPTAANGEEAVQQHDSLATAPPIPRDEPSRWREAHANDTTLMRDGADDQPPSHGIGGGTTAPDHRSEARRPTTPAIDDDAAGGWLPPERSWAELRGGEPAHHADDRDTAPPEPVPWSRPEAEHRPPGQLAFQPPNDGGPGTGSDPWAPPDSSSAEEYHNDTGAGRPSRGWRDTADEAWTTSPPPSSRRAHGDEIDDRPTADRPHHDPPTADRPHHDQPTADRPHHHHQPTADRPPTVAPGWSHSDETGASGHSQPADDHERYDAASGWSQPHEMGAARYDRWQPDGPADAGADITNGDAWRSNGAPQGHGERRAEGHAEPLPGSPLSSGHRRDRGQDNPREDTPPWEARAREEARDRGRPDDLGDPWSNVWDANHGPDAGEVWTPEFDTGLPALDVDVPDSPSGAGGADREAARPEPSLQAATPDEPVVHDTAPHHDRPTTPHHTPPDEPDVQQGHAHVAANEHHTPPDEPDVRQGHAHVAASGHDGATGRVNGHGPAPDSDAGDVPPPLASLRNPRRPDVPADPLEALQSLQAQLERLATGRRPARPPASRTGSRASGSGTDRHERH